MKRTCLPFEVSWTALWRNKVRSIGDFLRFSEMLKSSNCTKEFTSSVEVFLKSAKHGTRCLICLLIYVVLPRPGWSNFTCAYYVSTGLNHLSVSWLGTWFGIPGRPPGVWQQFEFGMTIFQVRPTKLKTRINQVKVSPIFLGHHSIHLYNFHLSLSNSFCIYSCLSVHLSVYRYISIYPSLHLSICSYLSIYLSIFLSIYLSI